MSTDSSLNRLVKINSADGPKWVQKPSMQPKEFAPLADKIKSRHFRSGLDFPFIGSCPLIVAPLQIGDSPEQCYDFELNPPKSPVESLGVWLDCKCVLAAFHAACLKSNEFRSATFSADPRIDLATFVISKCDDCNESPAASIERNSPSTGNPQSEHEIALNLLGRFARRIGTLDTILFEPPPNCTCLENANRNHEFGKKLHLEATISYIQHLEKGNQLRCSKGRSAELGALRPQ